MKKKFLFIVFMMFALTASASVKIGDFYYELNAETQTAELVAKRGKYWFYEEVVIPSSVNYEGIDYNVTSIANAAFEECYMTSVTISEGVTKIGNGAFVGCSRLTSVTIPNSVTTIGNSAFYRCSALPSIIIPDGVTTIGEEAFDGCTELTSVSLGSGLTSIGKWAFHAVGITSITFPQSLRVISTRAFEGCQGLTEVVIPDGVTTIGWRALGNCQNLTTVTVGKGIETMDAGTFEASDNIRNVALHCNDFIEKDHTLYEGIGHVFNSVGIFVLDEGLMRLGASAFSGCYVYSLTIPSSVTSIGSDAFYYSFSLADIYCYAEQVPETASNAFNVSNYTEATLHVPANAVDAYKSAEGWQNFGNIVALTDEDPKPTGVSTMEYAPMTTNKTIYDLQGHQLAQPKKGLNIIKMSDGTTKKVIIK